MLASVTCFLVGGFLGFIIAVCLIAQRATLPVSDAYLEELARFKRLEQAGSWSGSVCSRR